VRFEIAKGYYLYRDKFRFAAEPETRATGHADAATGQGEGGPKPFGEVEVYYQQALIRIPVERNSSGPLPLTLKVTSQGCADAGICYPPQQQTLKLELPDPATTPIAATSQRAPSATTSRDASRSCSRMPASGCWSAASSASGCCCR
jgi:thiol:disulfide interchange protein DsbD